MIINNALSEWATRNNYRVACLNTELLQDVRNTIDDFSRSQAIDSDFFHEWIAELKYLEDCTLPAPSTLAVIAVPSPAYILKFELPHRTLNTILPPTYVRYRSLFQTIKSDFQQNIARGNHAVEILYAPIKSLAARSGLMQYGRNNIGYIRGLGSYFQLICLVTDMPLEKLTNTHLAPLNYEQQMRDECRTCTRCIHACPAGAITEDRFLLKAHKCYTRFSESAKPIPVGVTSPSPQCIIGCLKCQWVCPVNHGMLKYEQAPVSFTQEETTYMLNTNPPYSGALWDIISQKFAVLGLTESPQVLIRNLQERGTGTHKFTPNC